MSATPTGGALDQETIQDLVRELGSENWADAAAVEAQLAAFGPRVVPFLCTALGAGSGSQRWRAARILGRLQDDRAVPALCAALAVHAEPVRSRAMFLPLRSRRPNREALFRMEAAAALGAIRSPLAAVPLSGALSDPSEGVRRAAQQALIAIGAPAVKPLADVITDSRHSRARQLAATALGTLADVRGIAPLCELLWHSDRDLRLTASNALAQFSRKNPAPELHAAVAPLRRLLSIRRLPIPDLKGEYRQGLEAALTLIQRRVPNAATLPRPADAPAACRASLPRPVEHHPHAVPDRREAG
jgi:HEAT repeat protein